MLSRVIRSTREMKNAGTDNRSRTWPSFCRMLAEKVFKIKKTIKRVKKIYKSSLTRSKGAIEKSREPALQSAQYSTHCAMPPQMLLTETARTDTARARLHLPRSRIHPHTANSRISGANAAMPDKFHAACAMVKSMLQMI